MKRMILSAGLALAIVQLAVQTCTAADHRFGAGIHYWRTIDDVNVDEFDEDGMAWTFSYQLRPAPLLGIELAVEALPDGYGGGAEEVYSPQAYLIVGKGIYAGLGVGGFYTDGDFQDDTFYALRAGLELELLPNVLLDVNANYRFTEWDDIKTVEEDVDTDTITLGAAVRLEL